MEQTSANDDSYEHLLPPPHATSLSPPPTVTCPWQHMKSSSMTYHTPQHNTRVSEKEERERLDEETWRKGMQRSVIEHL